MNGVNSRKGSSANGVKDRRSRHNLRNIFDKACQITAPFFDPGQSWAGSSLTMYARQSLRDAFPELTQQEIAILLSVVSRFHSNPEKKGE